MAPRWRPRHTMYLAASLSAWGDRMWTFAVGLYMVYATPNSLRLTAIYGLVISMSVIALGATVGRWVDTTARLRAAQLSLLVQNCAVCVCALILVVGIEYGEYTASTWRSWLHILLQVLVIFVADIAALATVANKIAIEKDWVVVMANGDQNTLAWMNSAFRTIDLGTYILAPVLVGQLMTFLSPTTAAFFMAGWNLVSLVVEYVLLRRVYRDVPQLARPKAPDAAEPLRKSAEPEEPEQTELLPAAAGPVVGATQPKLTNGLAPAAGAPDDSRSPPEREDGTGLSGRPAAAADSPLTGPVASAADPPPSAGCCGWPRRRLAEMRRSWAVYFGSSFRLAGMSLACLYMTVLGFDNITAGYGYTQGLSESMLSLLASLGAFVGICGSLCFPRLRRTFGPLRTGLIGYTMAVLAQIPSLISVFLPGTAFLSLADPDGPPSRASVAALFSGIILARFGLWVSDLSVTQLLQERVPESRRGAVSGVQSSLNMAMDTTKCVLVVAAPLASHFGVLIILSFISWFCGGCFFAAYAWSASRRPADSPEEGSPAGADVTAWSGDVTSPAGAPEGRLLLGPDAPPSPSPSPDSVADRRESTASITEPDETTEPSPPPAVIPPTDGTGSSGTEQPPYTVTAPTDGTGSSDAERRV